MSEIAEKMLRGMSVEEYEEEFKKLNDESRKIQEEINLQFPISKTKSMDLHGLKILFFKTSIQNGISGKQTALMCHLLTKTLFDLDEDHKKLVEIVNKEFEINKTITEETRKKVKEFEEKNKNTKRPIEIFKNFSIFNFGATWDSGSDVNLPS